MGWASGSFIQVLRVQGRCEHPKYLKQVPSSWGLTTLRSSSKMMPNLTSTRPPTVGIIVCEGESTSTFVRAKLCLVKPTSHFPLASCRHRAPVLGITVSTSSSNETGSENPLVTRMRTPCRRVTNLSPRARRAEIENSAPFHAVNSRRSAGNIAGTLPINSCGIFVIGRRTCDNQLALPLHRSSSCPSRVSLSFSTSVMMRNPSTDSAVRESSVNHAN